MKNLQRGSALFLLLFSTASGQGDPGFFSPTREPVISPMDPWSPPEQQADVPQAPAATPSTEWGFHKTADGNHPDGNEQQMLWLMNRARTNPEREGIWLADGITQSNVTSAISYFKVNRTILKAEFAAIPEAPPAAFDWRLYQGSKDHSDDLIARDAQDHTGQFDRLKAHGFNFNGAAASVYSYSKDPVHAHAGFNIDWGPGDNTGMQPGRGHRKGLMDTSFSSSLSNVGIAMIADNNNANDVGPLVTSIGYVIARTSSDNHYNRLITGTIWTDKNSNHQYDPDEGHGGVTILPDRGQFYAVTGDAGGFSIPATETGVYKITVSGGAITQAQQRQVEVGSESVMMIWNQADTWDDPVSLVIPAAPVIRMIVVDGQTRVTWQELGGLNYQLRQSTNLIAWQNDTRTILADGSTRYFLLTQPDIEQRRFFGLLVTPE